MYIYTSVYLLHFLVYIYSHGTLPQFARNLLPPLPANWLCNCTSARTGALQLVATSPLGFLAPDFHRGAQ